MGKPLDIFAWTPEKSRKTAEDLTWLGYTQRVKQLTGNVLALVKYGEGGDPVPAVDATGDTPPGTDTDRGTGSSPVAKPLWTTVRGKNGIYQNRIATNPEELQGAITDVWGNTPDGLHQASQFFAQAASRPGSYVEANVNGSTVYGIYRPDTKRFELYRPMQPTQETLGDWAKAWFSQTPNMGGPAPNNTYQQQQPGYPGGYPQQPGYPGGYPQQPGYPGGYPQQPGYPGGYPMYPGAYGGYPMYPGAYGGYPMYPGAYGGYPMYPGAYGGYPY